MTIKQLRCVGQILLCHCYTAWKRTEFHHGDCVGADEEAHQLAVALRLDVILHPPELDRRRAWCENYVAEREPAPYLDRNHNIVDETEMLVAAPATKDEQLRSGTWATVRYARKQGRSIYFAWPDGYMTLDGPAP